MKTRIFYLFLLSYLSGYCQLSKPELNQLAIDRYNVGDFQGAADFFSQVIKQFPNDSIAYSDRAMMKEFMKDFHGAIDDFTKQIIVDSSNLDAYFLRGINEQKLGLFDDALNDYSFFLEREFGNSDAHLFKGQILLIKNKNKEALIDLNDAISINAENVNALVERGWFNAMNGDYQIALNDLDKAILIDSTVQKAYQYRGWVKAENKDFKGALLDYEKMIALNPLASLEYQKPKKHKLDKFYPILNEALKRDTSELGQLNLAFLNLFLGRTSEANNILKKNVFSQNYLVMNLFGIAKSNFLLNKDFREVLVPINLAIQIEPNNPYLFHLRAELNLKWKNEKEACKDFEQYKMFAKEFKYNPLFKICLN